MARTNLSLKQHAFVAAYISNGGNASAAYRASYSTRGAAVGTIGQDAARLLRHPLVAPKIAEYREKQQKTNERAAEAATVTKAGLTATMAKLMRNAAEADDVRGAALAGTLIAKLAGWIVERRDVRVIKSLHDLSDDELAAIRASAEKEAADLTAAGAVH